MGRIEDHISSLYTDSWVAWVLLVLLVLVVVNQSLGWNVGMLFRSITSHSERMYGSQGQGWLRVVGSRVYCFGIMAMAMVTLLPEGTRVGIGGYVLTLGVVACVYIVQRMLIRWVGYVFVVAKTRANALEQYQVLREFVCMLLLPVVLVLLNFPSALLARILCSVVGGIYGLLLLVKCVQLFYKDVLSIVYIVLYMALLELLPLLVTIYWTRYMLV